MLNIKDISNRIENTQLITISDLDFLKKHSEAVPYCQIYSILYLKGLSLHQDIRFDQELNAHSYRITDRSQLYTLIQNKESIKGKAERTPTIEKPSTKSASSELIPKIAKEESAELNTVTEPIEIEGNSSISKTNETVENNTLETEEKTIDNVDQSILEHAFTANYALPELNEEEKNALEQKNNSSKESVEIETETAVEKEQIEIKIDTKQSFNSWLNSNQNYDESLNVDKDEILSVVEEKQNEVNSSTLFGKVEKPKKEFFSPTRKAKESLQEDLLPVSETLAKIYALQGNFPKAILAYNQLSLKYPEKKIFFAVQIKELQKKLN